MRDGRSAIIFQFWAEVFGLPSPWSAKEGPDEFIDISLFGKEKEIGLVNHVLVIPVIRGCAE